MKRMKTIIIFDFHLLGIYPIIILLVELARTQYRMFQSDDLIEQYAPEKSKTTFKAFLSNSEMSLMTYQQHCFDLPKMTSTNYIYIGSFAEDVPPKPLPEDLENIVNSSAAETIVVTFGSYKMQQEIVAPDI